MGQDCLRRIWIVLGECLVHNPKEVFMQLIKVSIKNFRGMEAQEIEFRPGFNLIKGENGRGKTSVLEAIAVGLGGSLRGWQALPQGILPLTKCVRNFQKWGMAPIARSTACPRRFL